MHPQPPKPTHHRSLFLSDMHIGAKGAKPQAVLAFLQANTADTLYLVGDIVDHWHGLGRNWAAEHHDLMRHMMDLPKNGTRVVYVPGNHDAFFRQYAGSSFNGVEVMHETAHETADGRRFLVLHGDIYDSYCFDGPSVARLTTLVESGLHLIDKLHLTLLRRLFQVEWRGLHGLAVWANNRLTTFNNFEKKLTELARSRGFDGVICGHFHLPALHNDHGPVYANCGDWLDTCSALAEGFDGRLHLIQQPGMARQPASNLRQSIPEEAVSPAV